MTTEREKRIDFEKELEDVLPCTCIDAYKLRHLDDPSCGYHNFDRELEDWAKSIAERVYRECADIADRQIEACRLTGEHSGTAELIRNCILKRMDAQRASGEKGEL